MARGWREPTPVQALAVPALATGKDVIVRAETGSGKTGAFGLVLTDAVRGPGIKALVLAPTRELAQQVARDLNALATGAAFRAAAVYGGVPYDEQLAAIRDPATTCLVATPGRLLDFLGKKQVDLSEVRVVIVDEADRMLDFGFLPDVERILQRVPKERQTGLFSATMPKEVAKLARTYLANPREIAPNAAALVPESSEHYVAEVPSSRKTAALLAVLEREAPGSALVFTRTRESARRVADALAARGFAARAFHGDLAQDEREALVAAWRAGDVRLIVATDVAARGLHVPHVTHVVNFDVPEEPEQYVHRAGRTARAGARGRIITLVSERDVDGWKAAQDAARIRPRRYVVGPLGDAEPDVTEPGPPAAPRAARSRPRSAPRDEGAARVDAPEHDLPPSRRAGRRSPP